MTAAPAPPVPLTDKELAGYEVAPEGYWEVARLAGDGYDRMEVARRYGWRETASWGLGGWDLGQWPYVVIFVRNKDDLFEAATNCEGDTTVYRFPNRELRNAAIDAIAFFHWKHQDEDWVKGIATAQDMPPKLRGPFSWKRLDAETPGWLNGKGNEEVKQSEENAG